MRIPLSCALALACGLAGSSGAALQFTNLTSGMSAELTAATYDGANTFVAVGRNSAIYTGIYNTNRLNWTGTNVPSAAWLRSAAFGDQFFVVGGTNAATYISVDGLNWAPGNNAFKNPATVHGLAFNPTAGTAGRFAAVASIVNITWADGSFGWTDAAIPSAVFFESYRGVTPMGVNGFAAVGIRGTVRLSPDGGQTWNVSRPMVINQQEPDLFGIAFDGNQTLVAVGQSGRILCSLDSGATWQAASSPAGAANLNAVAWNGTEFVAVGNDGAIIASANGVNWLLQSAGVPAGFAAHLAGITYATSGNLKGVGMLVGTNGTVLLAGTLPPKPQNPLDTANCSYLDTNNALRVSITNEVFFAVDWYDSQTGGTKLLEGSTSYVPADRAPGLYTYWAETRDKRTGYRSSERTAVTLTLYPRPTAEVTGTRTICNSESAILSAALTGTAPWTVTWSDGLVQVTNGSPVTRVVTPANILPDNATNFPYTVTALTDANTCSSFPSNLTGIAVITVNPRPTAVASGTATICNGESTVLQAALTGIGPWTVTWADGFVQTTNGRPALRVVSPANPLANFATNASYSVAAVSDANCTAQPGDISGNPVVTINPRPTAWGASGQTICNGESTFLIAGLTGIGPWTVTWSDGFVQTTNLSPAMRHVSPPNPHDDVPTNYTYTVTALTDSNCFAQPGDLTVDRVITVNPRPKAVVSGTATICNAGSTTLQAALNGVGPWTVTWSDGLVQTTNGRPATRVVAPANPHADAQTNYTFSVTAVADANCTAQVGDISGNAVIAVNPRPTAVASGNATICNGESTVLQAALTGFGPWTVTWSDGFVQTTNGRPATRIVGPANPHADAFTNYTYAVTAVVDANCTAQAGDISGNAVIRVNPRPTAVASGNATICNGESTILQAALTGLGPWTVTWSDGFVQTTNGRPATRVVSPANPHADAFTNYTYAVTAVTDANCTAQPGDISGNAVVTVNPRPTAVAIGTATICNGGSTTLQAALTGIGPWTVTWSDGLVQTTNGRPATRVVAPANLHADAQTNYTFAVTAVADANCTAQPGDISGDAVITVNPRPTAVATGTATICNGSSTTLQAALTGIGPWTVTWSDGFVQTTNGRPATRVVAPANPHADVSTNASFSLTAVADANCSAQPGDISGNAVITINPRPTAVASGTATICNGESTTLQAALTGIGPWTITWADGFVQATNGRPALRTVSPANLLANAATNASYSIASVSDVNCAAEAVDISGTAVVTINPRPAAVASGSTTVCNGETATLQAALTGLGPWTVTWSDGFVQTTNGSTAIRTVAPANSLPNNATNFAYTVTALTDAHCTATTGDLTGTATITVNPRPAVVVSGTNSVCDGEASVVRADLTGLGPWAVTWNDGSVSNAIENFVLKTVTVASTNANEATTAFFAVTSVSNANGCVSGPADISGGALITVNPRLKAAVSGTNTICEGESTSIVADLTGIGPWEITWSDGTVSNVTVSPAMKIVTPAATNTAGPTVVFYTITALSNALSCVNEPGDITGGAQITINPRPTAQVAALDDQVCDGGIALIYAELTGTPPWTVTWSDGFVDTNVLASPAVRALAITNSGTVALTNAYTVSAVADAHCTAVPAGITGVAMVVANPTPALPVVTGVTNCVGTTNLTLTATVGTGETADWYDGTGTNLLAAGTLMFTPTNTLAGTYTFQVAGRNGTTGCVSTNLALATLVLQDCNVPLLITQQGTNVVIQWVGAFQLQSTAMLTNPPVGITWSTLTNGAVGTNYWTNNITGNQEFFRLYAPTN